MLFIDSLRPPLACDAPVSANTPTVHQFSLGNEFLVVWLIYSYVPVGDVAPPELEREETSKEKERSRLEGKVFKDEEAIQMKEVHTPSL